MREPPDDKPLEWRELEEIFADLLESEDPDSRLASIEDPVLRAAATRIWNHHMNAASAGFLQEPAVLGMVGAFQPGQRLSARFVIERLLGTGGMGQVYLAKDDLLGVHVAVKTIAPMLAPLPYMRRRFVAEVQNARRVTHRNVCRIYDYFEDGPLVFFAMEYLDGSTLDAILRGGRRPEAAQIRRWLCEIASGLQAAHDEGVLHGDFKPGNIIVTAAPESRAVITDFGLARALEDPSAAGASGFESRESLQAGTVEYMAPEILAGGPASVAADLYAFGKVAEKLLPDESWWRPFLRFKPSDRPPSLREVIRQLLPRDPATTRRNVLFGAAIAAAGGVGVVGLWTRPDAAAAIPKGSRIFINGVSSVVSLAHTAKSLRTVLLAGLQLAPRIQVITDRETIPELRKAGPAARLPLEGRLLQETASALQAGYWIESALVESAGLYNWTMRLHRASDGLAVLDRRFERSSSIVLLAETAVRWIREVSGESADSRNAIEIRLASFTTRAPEALDRYAEAMDLYYAGEMQHAIPLLEQAIKIDPDFAQAHAMLGMSHNTMRRARLAVECLERAMTAAAKLAGPESSVIAANYYKMIEDPDRMIEESRKCTIQRPYDPYHYRQLANLFCWIGDAAQSISPIRKAIEVAPRQHMLLGELLVNLCEANRVDEAARELAAIRAQNITNGAVERGAGLVHLCEGRYQDASAAFQRMSRPPERILYGPAFLLGEWNSAVSGWSRALSSARAENSEVEEHEYGEYLSGTYHLMGQSSLALQYLTALPQLSQCPPNARRLQAEAFWASRLHAPAVFDRAQAGIWQISTRWPNRFTIAMQRYVDALGASAKGDLSLALRLIQESESMAFSVLTMIEAAEIADASGATDLASDYWRRFEQRAGTVLKIWFPGYLLYAWHAEMQALARAGSKTQGLEKARKILRHWGKAMPQSRVVQDAELYLHQSGETQW